MTREPAARSTVTRGRRTARWAHALAAVVVVTALTGCSGATGGSTPSASTVADPSGQAMPVGDLPGWKQVFTDDFTHPVALGSWPGPYAKKWNSYTSGPDTSHVGVWASQETVSVADGMADYYLHSKDGVPQGAALLPRTAAQTYGRYTVRFKVDPGLSNWASAWLLWPDDNVWPAHGEIDWPEGELTSTMGAFNHFADEAGGQEQTDTDVSFPSGWHTATTEWTRGKVTFILDGMVIGTSTTGVSTHPMHWVLQSETAYGDKPASSSSGHIKIDWVAVYRQAAASG